MPVAISLSVGFGLGIASWLLFIWLILFGSRNNIYVIIDFFVFVCFITAGLYFLYWKKQETWDSQISLNLIKKTNRFFHATFWIALIISLTTFVLRSINNPHGGWDGWAIWNMRARFIFRGGEQWVNAFSNVINWSHPDYPLLIPLNITRIWRYLGLEAPIAPISIAFLFTFSTVALLGSSISYIHDHRHGILASLVLLGISAYFQLGSAQYADVPLGFFILATLILFFVKDKLPERSLQIIFMAGIMAGLAAWTKNEGLLFILCVVIVHLITSVLITGLKTYKFEAAAFISGILPSLLFIIYFKYQLAPPSSLLSGVQLTIERFTDSSRYLIIGKEYIITSLDLLKYIIILFPLSFVLLGFSYPKRFNIGIKISIITLTLMNLGYIVIYLVSPYELDWHLDTSLERLILQLLPSAIFLFFIFLSTPEDWQTKRSFKSIIG